MPKCRKRTKTSKIDLSITNAKILNAEKRSILIAIPIGLLAGLIAYFTTSNFSMVTLVISIGAFAITAVLLFHFHFGKDLPKRVISPEEYGSPLSFYKSSSFSENSGAQAYNRANGNPSSNFILPKKYL